MQQLELDMEQQTGSKYEKEYVKDAYCHPAYLTYMQSGHTFQKERAMQRKSSPNVEKVPLKPFAKAKSACM